MRERFEIYIAYKWRYINTLPFLNSFTTSYLTSRVCATRFGSVDTKDRAVWRLPLVRLQLITYLHQQNTMLK